MVAPNVSTGPTPRRDEIEADLPSANHPPTSAEAQTDDDSLILWMLSLNPTRRLAMAQGFVDSVTVLRNGRRLS